jgi:translation initiation factor IF-2
MARRPKKKTVSKAEQKSVRRLEAVRAKEPVVESAPVEVKPTSKKPIELPATIVVRDFATLLDLPVGKVIAELVKNGIMATLNNSIDFDTAAIVADELGFEARREEAAVEEAALVIDEKVERLTRPPVVTVMGHVDHGKTKLLDAIRETNVVAQESGGITQHIGAYQVKVKDRTVTFLDTPGHEAFAALRAHGANITDLVILVVAVTEGVRPQTIEALSHARAANVPIIVALNKMDLPEANPDRTKKELADHGLIAEEWGGKTTMVPVSAKTGENLEQLLDMVLLVADLAELKARADGPAVGVVIESHLQSGLGPLASVLVQEGRLKVGDALTVGTTYGKIRVMQDWRGKKLSSATPGMPVQIAGLRDVPHFGDRVRVVVDEKTARALVATKSAVRHALTLTSLSASIKEGKIKELPIILKADVQGSLEAIKQSLENLSTTEVAVKLISAGIGAVSDSDIQLAGTAQALVLAFRVPVLPSAKKLAEQFAVHISSYDIIYQLIDEVAAALAGLLAPEIIEVDLGRLLVLKVFRSAGSEAILGGKVLDGTLERNAFARVLRNGAAVGEGKIRTLQREKESVQSVAKGFECGLGLEGSSISVQVGDTIVAFRTEERARRLQAKSE